MLIATHRMVLVIALTQDVSFLASNLTGHLGAGYPPPKPDFHVLRGATARSAGIKNSLQELEPF